MAKLLCLFALWATCGLAQTVEGTVFDAATGAGLGGVKVELLKGATPFYETISDGGGHFRIENIREGDYAARYQSPDYWLTAGPSDYRQFHVAAAAPVKLEARLMPWSKISGRVVDGQGNGVPNAELELTGLGMISNGRTYLRTSWGGGGGGQITSHPMEMRFLGNADAHGNFEVQLMPGSYGLSVIPPKDMKPPAPEKDGPVLAWRRTYYPGVEVPEAASKIVVLPGGEISDVELKLLAIPAHAVRGVVLLPDGTPAAKVTIHVGDAPLFDSAESKADGTFEFAAVPEGETRFFVQVRGGPVELRATQWIDVPRHDLETVKLRLVSPLAVRGKVIINAPKDTAAPKPGPMILSILGGRSRGLGDMGPMGASLASPNAQGEFTVQDAYPGLYGMGPLFQTMPLPYYLDSIRIGDADLTRQDVEIASDTEITVVYKSDSGVVQGKAESCAGGGVILVPSEPAMRRPAFSKSGPCDASDHYEVRAVRPGEYYALALAGDAPVVVLNDALITQGGKVTVRAGEVSTVDLKTVTKPVFTPAK